MSVHTENASTTCNLQYDCHMQEQGVQQLFFTLSCGNSAFSFTFLVLAITYKFILHAIALVLAFKIRKLKITALNDSRETVAIIYCCTVLLLVESLLLFVLFRSISTITILWAIFVSSIAMVHLLLTFAPKVSIEYLHAKNSA